jgi:hypothetical protein
MISDEAVEKAARALYEKQPHTLWDQEAGTMLGTKSWEALNESYREALRDDARTVIASLTGACPPRVEGDKPHCPDCSGIVGETGIVW